MTILFTIFTILISNFIFFSDVNADNITAIKSEHLIVDKDIKIWYETFGNKNGIPLFILHGGPGSNLNAIKNSMTKYIDLNKFYVVLSDQRGCGQSEPLGWFEKNKTVYLVEDIEKLRKHLNLEKINIWGNSWGSTLALAYSQKYYKNINNLLVSGIYLGEKETDEWFINGLGNFFPEQYDAVKKFAPNSKTGYQAMEEYHKIIFSNNTDIKRAAVAAFNNYEAVSFNIIGSDSELTKAIELNAQNLPESSVKRAEIFFSYMVNGAYLDDDFLSTNKMSNIDKNCNVTIMNGRYDMCVTTAPAYKLKSMMPDADFIIVNGAGHSTKTNQNYIDTLTNYFNKM